ncbi:MAG: hypothetical protein ACYTG0_46460, partial [Planctomycetota bacterium]
LEWVDEWTPFWAEIWGSTPNADDVGVSSFTATLTYDTARFSATQIEFGPAFTAESAIDDDAGVVDIVGSASQPDAGDDQYVLLARVLFRPDASDVGVPHNADGQYVTPIDGLQFDVQLTQAESGGASRATVESGEASSIELWPVMYDVDDDGHVGFGDLAYFAEAFQQTVGDPEAPFAWACDFDHSGRVDVGDLAFFAENFQNTLESPMVYPANFPEDWRTGSQTPQSRSTAAAPVAGDQAAPTQPSTRADRAIAGLMSVETTQESTGADGLTQAQPPDAQAVQAIDGLFEALAVESLAASPEASSDSLAIDAAALWEFLPELADQDDSDDEGDDGLMVDDLVEQLLRRR